MLKPVLYTVTIRKASAHTPRAYENRVAPLSVCGPACSGCPDAKVVSTPNCRGCFARPCVYSCPKNAIAVTGGDLPSSKSRKKTYEVTKAYAQQRIEKANLHQLAASGE